MRKCLPFLFALIILSACQPAPSLTVTKAERWGIYRLDLTSGETSLIYSAPREIGFLRLSPDGSRFAFAQSSGGDQNEDQEIYTLDVDGMGLTQITDNAYWDLYPAWSPDGGELAFLSWRANSLGLYGLDLVSGEVREVIDSPDHEADPDWGGDLIAFTRNSRIWIIEPNGSGARSLSNPPRAGEWGDANLPYGDYDPRISPDGSQVVFERLVDADSPHGGYDLFLIDLKTSQETRLTNVGYSLGLADWSPDGSQLVFIVSAVEGEGRYDLYLINADGSGLRDITPEYYPSNFLCRWVEFSADGKALYFVGEWWEQE